MHEKLREPKRLADDEVGAGHRLVDIAVAERAIVDARVGRRRLDGVEHGLEWVVVDEDGLGRVLGEVAVTRDDDRQRLSDVAGDPDRGGVERNR